MAESESGGIYEFDAPTHVVDFKELVNSQTDDSWFEHVGENNVQLITPLRPEERRTRGGQSEARAIAQESGQREASLANIVTSWGADTQPQRIPAKEAAAQPRRVLKRKETTSRPAAPPPKKQKDAPVRRPQSGPVRTGCRRSQRLSAKAVTSSSTSAELCSSEQLEMERIRNLQREVALQRRKNEASYKAALAGVPLPKKALLSTTVPHEFHFNSDRRVKAAAPSDASGKEMDFTLQLRKATSPTKARRGATVPKPFNFSKGSKRPAASGAYVPMAQQIKQFEKKTPTRYHIPSHKSQERGPSPVKANHLKITQPHSPRLMTRQRSRPQAVKSSSELEAEELQQLHSFKIKAQELNKKILEAPEDLKKPPVKEPTVPEGFELEIEKRLQERQQTKKSQEDEEKGHNFRARPLPKKVLEGVVGLPDKKVLHPTVPESPAFALKKRIRLDRKVEETKPPSPVKAPPVPHFGLPFQPRLPDHHQVEVCPFSFEQRERERRALKEKKLEELRNEEVPQFKAQPLPAFDAVVLPEKKKAEPTKPEPFRLLLDERGAVKSSRWEQMVKEEQKQQEEAAAFKARPVSNKEPFRPKKESRSSTVTEAFELATERRAREWQEYERVLAEKETLRARMEAEQRREEEEKLKEEISRLRQEQVHKAQPIRHYKPVAVKKSEIPLTVPESPNFSDRFRL